MRLVTLRARPFALAAATAAVLTACGGSGTASPSTTVALAASVDSIPGPSTSVLDGAPRCGIASAGGFDDILCSEPHDAEFVGMIAAPGEAEVATESFEGAAAVAVCLPMVEAYIGRPLTGFVMDVGTVADVDEADEIECWAHAPVTGVLTAAIAEVGLPAALGDVVEIAALPPGSCFTSAADDYYGLGFATECVPGGEIVAGVVEATPGEWRGDTDALADEYFERCTDLVATSPVEFAGPPESIIYPSEEEWVVYGRTAAICLVLAVDESVPQPFVGTGRYTPGLDAPICLDDRSEDGSSSDWVQVDCTEPHSSELAAMVELPEGVLPADFDQAVQRLAELCAPSVVAYTRHDFTGPGVFVSTRVSGSLGQPVESAVDCIATVNEPVLIGSFQEADLADLMGDVRLLSDLRPGTCFVFPGDATSLAVETGCEESGALMFVGTYQMAERDDYPDLDALRAERRAECTRVWEASGLGGDPATLSGTFIAELNYVVLGGRTATCDIAPA